MSEDWKIIAKRMQELYGRPLEIKEVKDLDGTPVKHSESFLSKVIKFLGKIWSLK